MIKKILTYNLFLIILASVLFSQEKLPIRLINADSLVGAELNGEPIRILVGNVHLVQGDVEIFCDRGTQFLNSNRAHLEGNVRVNQKNVSLKSNSGTYDGKTEIAYSDSKIRLFDGNVYLIADRGFYYFNEDKAYFLGNVSLCDDSTHLLSNELVYYSKLQKAIATGNVSIEQKEDIIYADSLIHFRETKKSIANNNVLIFSPKNNLKIYSDYLINYEQEQKSILKGNSLLIQIDTIGVDKLDTLIISCDSIEIHRGPDEIYKAYDSVKMWRGHFSAIADFLKYFKTENFILTYKSGNSAEPPVFWQDENQIFADSIVFYLFQNKITSAELFNDCFIISKDSLSPTRFNQLNGTYVKLSFSDDELEKVLIKGKALSIYYFIDDGAPNGLNKSSADSIVITLKDRKVDLIDLYGNPEGEYHPEELIIKKDEEFRLAGFKWITNRPQKEYLLKKRDL